MQTLNLIACAILFAISSWAVLSSHFNDGVMLKKGLIIAAMTSLAGMIHYFQPGYTADPLTVVTNAGFAIVIASMVKRRVTRAVWRQQ